MASAALVTLRLSPRIQANCPSEIESVRKTLRDRCIFRSINGKGQGQPRKTNVCSKGTTNFRDGDRTWDSDQSRGWCREPNPDVRRALMWFRVAVEWKYALCSGLRSCSTDTRTVGRTSVISLGQESAHQDGSLLGRIRNVPLSVERSIPIHVVTSVFVNPQI